MPTFIVAKLWVFTILAFFLLSNELLILDRWACSSWEKCKRLYSLSFSGVVIAAGPLSGTPASRSLAHGLSYANVPVATPSRAAPILEQKLLCDVARPSTQRYIWATTWGWQDSSSIVKHSTSNYDSQKLEDDQQNDIIIHKY